MMANPWFRMYSEFAHDAKVQMMSEAMQRRYIMLLCMRCSNDLVTLHETEIAFHMRISETELAETKQLFVSKGFIDEDWNLLNWEKRQFASDSSAARVARHREKKKTARNVDVTLQKRKSNALDTDTDTDTEKNTTATAVVSSEPVSSKPPAADDSPIFISIPTNKFNTAGEERPITENKIDEWQVTYPGVDVRQTLIRIRSWVVNNPNKRKTFSGIFRFIDTWLAKEQNQFGGQHATSHQPHGNNRSAGNRPFAEIVGQQARDVIQRLGGHGNHCDTGGGVVRQDGSVVSEQSQV